MSKVEGTNYSQDSGGVSQSWKDLIAESNKNTIMANDGKRQKDASDKLRG